MSRMKRMFAILLVLCTLIGMMPAAAMPAWATEDTSGDSTDTGNVITRAQWIVELVAAFSMTVEEDTAPDNYFSNLTGEEEYYRDIIVAVEFGIIDISAGLPFRPEDPATREFAAQTLNFCLGFQLDEDIEYTFIEASTVTYPKDIQIAINRGWFALEDGAFLPEQTITAAEKDTMLADVAAVLVAQTEVAAKGHSYNAVVTAPTCTEKGYTTHTCACSDSFVDTYVDATGHSFGEWVTTKPSTGSEYGEQKRVCACGEEETRMLPKLGDVNGDGEVNTTDAKLIMQFELRLISEDALNLMVADVTGDGRINTGDAKEIMQFELKIIIQFSGENKSVEAPQLSVRDTRCDTQDFQQPRANKFTCLT